MAGDRGGRQQRERQDMAAISRPEVFWKIHCVFRLVFEIQSEDIGTITGPRQRGIEGRDCVVTVTSPRPNLNETPHQTSD